MAKNTNNNQPSPGDQAETTERVHMVTFLRDLEIEVIRRDAKQMETQLYSELDKYSLLEYEHDDLQIEHARLQASYEAQTKIIEKQRKELMLKNRHLQDLDRCKSLALMAEEVFLGSVDKTALDYLKKIQQAREHMFLSPTKQSEEKLK